MPDEPTISAESGPTYEVVGYGDVRAVAEDAATSAVESLDARTDAELQSVADASAAAALDGVIDEIAETSDEHLQEVADKSLEGVSSKLDDTVARIQQVADKALADIDSRAESVESVQVAIDSAQYEYLQKTLGVLISTSFLSLLVSCLLLGVLLWQQLVRGWQR